MSDKKNNGLGDYREEMEELARIFKEELDKTVEEAEENEAPVEAEEYEVEGYEVTMGDKKPVEELSEDELCECCGERARGTRKDPNSPFCSECEAILEKYPYDWKGATTAIVTLFVTLAAVICFIMSVPLFSHTFEAEKAHNEGKYFTALQKYNKALAQVDEEDDGAYLSLYEKKIHTNYMLLDMDSVLNDANQYFSDFAKKTPMYKDVADIEEEIMAMQSTVLVIQDIIAQYEDISKNNYNEIIGKLDALSGKKIYVSKTAYHLEGEKDFTPTGKEKVYVCDDAWIEMYKYSAAQYLGEDEKEIAKYLANAAEKSDYISVLVNPLLAATYVGIGEYDKAEALLPAIKEANVENVDYHMIKSMLYRYRDKDYNKGKNICIEGLNMITAVPDGSSLVSNLGYILSMQKTLNYIMMDDYKSAYASAKECYLYQAESYAISVQVRDMYAMLALKNNDMETFEALEEEIKEYGDAEAGFSQDVKDYREGKVTLKELAMDGGYDLL